MVLSNPQQQALMGMLKRFPVLEEAAGASAARGCQKNIFTSFLKPSDYSSVVAEATTSVVLLSLRLTQYNFKSII